MNTVDQEQQPNEARKKRLENNVNRLASRRTIPQIILSISSFVVELQYGIRYINDCPIQPLINVFLIVHGSSSLANGILLYIGFLTAKRIKRSPNHSPWVRHLFIGTLYGQLVYLLFSIAWLIAGQVWVFGAQTHGFQSSNSTDSSTYCNSSVFWTGFVIIIVTYAVWLILIIVLTVKYFVKRYKMKHETTQKTDERV